MSMTLPMTNASRRSTRRSLDQRVADELELLRNWMARPATVVRA